MIGRFWMSAIFVLANSVIGAAADGRATRPKLQLRQDIALEITRLRRLDSERVVELRFKVVNRTDRATTLKDLGIAFGHQLGQIALIDFDTRKKYGIGHAGNCLCSSFPERDGGMVPARGEREFWAWFRPANQTTLAVEFPGFPPLLGVRIQ